MRLSSSGSLQGDRGHQPGGELRMRKMRNLSGLAARVSGLVVAIMLPAVAYGATCDSLKSLSLPEATIDSVQVVTAGAFTQPGGRAGRGGNAFADLPAFCRVALTAKPSSDSDIKIEVWLPADNWN